VKNILKSVLNYISHHSTQAMVLFFGSFLLPIVSIYLTIQQNEKINELDNRYKPEEYKAFLRPIGKPHIISGYLKADSILNNRPNGAGLIEAASKIHVKLRYSFVNDGNSVAKIRGKLIGSCNCSDEEIRKLILAPELDTTKIKSVDDNSSFPEEVAPKDTTEIENEIDISETYDYKIRLHYIVTYENSTGDYFDTYVGIEGKIKDLIMAVPIEKFEKAKSTKHLLRKSLLDSMVIMEKRYPSYHIFSQKEKENFMSNGK
jgi:hypothetical protein